MSYNLTLLKVNFNLLHKIRGTLVLFFFDEQIFLNFIKYCKLMFWSSWSLTWRCWLIMLARALQKYSQAVLARIKSINCRTDKLEPSATIYVYCLEAIEEKLHLSITTIETKGSQWTSRLILRTGSSGQNLHKVILSSSEFGLDWCTEFH
jgi:hypothetical protein